MEAIRLRNSSFHGWLSGPSPTAASEASTGVNAQILLTLAPCVTRCVLNLTSHSLSIASGLLLLLFLCPRLHYSSICALLKGRMSIKGWQHSGANDSACEYAAGEAGYDHQEGVKEYGKLFCPAGNGQLIGINCDHSRI